MNYSKKKMAIWLGGLAAGIAVGAVIFQNRDKLGLQKEKISKVLRGLQKTGAEIGQKIKQVGLDRV